MRGDNGRLVSPEDPSRSASRPPGPSAAGGRRPPGRQRHARIGAGSIADGVRRRHQRSGLGRTGSVGVGGVNVEPAVGGIGDEDLQHRRAQVHGGGLASLPGSKQGQEPGACPGVQHRGGRGRQQAAQPGGPRRQLLGTPRIAPRRGVVTGRVVVSEPAGLLGMLVAVTLGVLALWSCPWPGRSVRRCGLGGVPFLLDLAEVPD